MIDNLWIAICLNFAFSIFLFARLWHVETLVKELSNQIDLFMDLQVMHNSRLNERVYALESRSKFRRVK